MNPKLLDGIRVLDLTNVLAGPYAGYQLSLMGADVIKIEVPGSGDLARQLGADRELSERGLGASFLAQNAGKRSMTVDLKRDAGKDVFTRLLQGSDVLLENFRPGVLERLGFSWDTLKEINPALVYCAVSGFGSTGPMRERPAYDQVIQGLSGIMSVTGTPETSPLRVGFPVCDSMGGLSAAMAVCAALYRQQATGEGTYIDVSMLDAAISSMGWVVSDHLIGGRQPIAMANENITSAPSGTFDTADGRLNIAANKQEQFETLCHVLERDDLVTDTRFVTRDDRKANREQLRAELEATLRTRPATEWDRILLPTGVPAAPVVDLPTALETEQVAHRGLVTTMPSTRGPDGELRLIGLPAHIDGESVGPDGPPPLLGEHTDDILRDLGYDTDAIGRLHDEGTV